MEITKKEIEKLIELRKEDTFLNHFWNILSRNYQPTGEVGRTEIKIWRQSIWNSTFYPIFIFELNANNHLVNIKDKINPIGKLFFVLFVAGQLYLLLPRTLPQADYLLSWVPFLVGFAFLWILILIGRSLYRFEKKNQLKQIFEILDIETEPEKIEKEWSLKNILIRSFTYPFCLFLIFLSIFLYIPEGQYLLTFGTLAMVGFYLVSDLRMILRKKTNGNNV